MKNIFKILLPLIVIVLLQSCSSMSKKKIDTKNADELIDTSKVIVEGKKDMDKKIIDGPKPYESTVIIEQEKRRTITEEKVKGYVSISEDFTNLKQLVSINFQGIDFKYAMSLMADIGEVNILVGDEVSGTVNAKIKNVPWDVAFQTLLDMKTLGADIDAPNGVIRVHTPDKLKGQETFKAERAETLKKKIESEEAVQPIIAQMFKLYYISPAQAKATIEDLFNLEGDKEQTAGTSTITNLSITIEDTTRSIIVRGHEEDLDVIDAVVQEIDVRTKQVLIEAFIVEAGSDLSLIHI